MILFDVLGQAERLPGAVPATWLAQAGEFDDAVQQQAVRLFEQGTKGRQDTALVFYCLSRECWMSYNASLRAIQAGYTNVLWYRGGIEAWKAAGLPTQSGAAEHAQPQPGFAPPAELRIGQSHFFSYALPQGWRVGEEGQFALTLLSPDDRAFTLMVGNAGLPPNHAPVRFAFDKLSALQPRNLQIGVGRQAKPAAGFRQAVEFDVSFLARGFTHRGVAKVSIAPAYDSATMAMTAALTAAEQWSSYATWLPQVADQVAATSGAAFGMRGIMQQNLQNSVAFGEAARQDRDWSQKNWQQVTDQRSASQDRQNFARRENLGGVQTFTNPYGGSPPLELPMTHHHYWIDRLGSVVGTDDPSANPNTGSTGDWCRMERLGRQRTFSRVRK